MKTKPREKPEYSARISRLRKFLNLKQIPFARRLSVDQGAVSKWEAGKNRPEPSTFVRLAGLAHGVEKRWFLEQAGVADVSSPEPTKTRKRIDDRLVWVPLLHDPVGAGLLRNVSEIDVDREIPFAADLMPNGGKLRAFKVSGDSMAPIINDGYVIVVDAAQRDPRKLVGQMVAAREDDGITIKWLRKDKGEYLLVPQHVSPRIDVRIMRAEDDWGIVGVVVKWIGYPAPLSGK
jgi:SOS-response transcriptional repressor LexA